METKNRKGTGYSVDKKVLADFHEYCKSNAINKSRLVEKLMRDYLQENKHKQ